MKTKKDVRKHQTKPRVAEFLATSRLNVASIEVRIRLDSETMEFLFPLALKMKVSMQEAAEYYVGYGLGYNEFRDKVMEVKGSAE